MTLPPGLVGDGATSPIDQGVDTVLLVAAAFLGLVAALRLRRRGFVRLPVGGAWALAGLAGACVVLAFVLPPIIRPASTGRRPASSARVAFESPRPGQVLRGAPASVPVRLRLTGGGIVPFTSTRLVANEGHIHLILDGALVSMTLSLAQRLPVFPGRHTLEADFVAVDHAPFDPPVRAFVSFVVQAPS